MDSYREKTVRTTARDDGSVEEQHVEMAAQRGSTIPEPAPTEYVTAPTYRGDPMLDQFVRVMWYVLGLLEGLLALRFVLALAAANPRNEFAMLIYGVTGPFVAPFRTLFPTPTMDGSVFEGYTLIAMLVYALAWWAVVRLVEVLKNRPVGT